MISCGTYGLFTAWQWSFPRLTRSTISCLPQSSRNHGRPSIDSRPSSHNTYNKCSMQLRDYDRMFWQRHILNCCRPRYTVIVSSRQVNLGPAEMKTGEARSDGGQKS